MLISGYPNSSILEPEYYIAQVVTVFLNYELSLVQKAVRPTGIPYDHPKFLPTVGEIDRWLAAKMAHLERIYGQQALPPIDDRPVGELRPSAGGRIVTWPEYLQAVTAGEAKTPVLTYGENAR